jgi:hypothetical protein
VLQRGSGRAGARSCARAYSLQTCEPMKPEAPVTATTPDETPGMDSERSRSLCECCSAPCCWQLVALRTVSGSPGTPSK